MSSQHSVFTKKHEEVIAQDQKAILEEMNLPPAVISFIRGHEKQIKIVLATAFLLVVAWEGFSWYQAQRLEKSSAMLYNALKAADSGRQAEHLQALINAYGGTGSAAWAKVELGHLAFKEGRFDEAAERYRAVLDDIGRDNPMYPLVQYILAQALENQGEYDGARDLFLQLAETKGFAGPGYLGLARVYEKQGDMEQAASYYQEYMNLPETQASATTREWVRAKISRLKAA